MDIRTVGTTSQTPLPVSVEKKAGTTVTPPVAPNITAEAVAAVATPKEQPSLAQVSQALDSINQAMRAMSQDLEFSIDSETNQTVVKIVDQKTQEVLRQIPSVEALAIAKALDHAQGLLIRQKA